MKKLFTLLALSSLLSGFASAAETSKDASKPTPAAPNARLAAYEKVARDNEQLKMQAWQLAEQVTELKSQLAYEQMMANMLLQLRSNDLEDAIADRQASLDYNRMMASLFQQLDDRALADRQDDARALAAYNEMMENMFRHLHTPPAR